MFIDFDPGVIQGVAKRCEVGGTGPAALNDTLAKRLVRRFLLSFLKPLSDNLQLA